jgi:hypothetical protein
MSTDKIFNKGAINKPCRVYKKTSTQCDTVWCGMSVFGITGQYFSEVTAQ